ncbi:contactin-associated protein-like 2 [Clytia hemisphaerica]|uniref:Uncharacterized protein n=1 Tax=Clytia hemisphaerica TaxID=252671 RepID=A0A7M5WW85_9CNID
MSNLLLLLLATILAICTNVTESSNSLTTSFTGKQYIEYKIPARIDATSKDKITLKFRTIDASGVLLYSCGEEGDFLLLEMKRGKLVYTGNFGSAGDTNDGVHQIIINKQYNDGKWHEVTLLRKEEEGETDDDPFQIFIHITVDDSTISKKPDGAFKQLNLDQSFLVGGLGNRQRLDRTCLDLNNRRNFTGCLQDVHFNSVNLLYGAKEMFRQFKVHGGTLPFTCTLDYEIIGFHHEQSTLVAKRNILKKNELKIAIQLRTFEPNGHIFTHKSTDGSAVLGLVKGKLQLTLSFLSLTQNDAATVKSNIKLDDGDWHNVEVTIKRNESEIFLNVDHEKKRFKFPDHFELIEQFGLLSSEVRFGGSTLQLPGLVSCFRKIQVDGAELSLKTGKNIKENSQKLISNVCQIRDLCFPSPCQHGSTCTQFRGNYQCNCAGTGYQGRQCQTCVYKRTCEEYKVAGETKSGNYKICPKNEHIFNVYCDMKSGATIMKHSLKNDTQVSKGDQYDGGDHYYHSVNYQTSLDNIKEIVNVSLTCRQYIRYDCFKSHLLYGIGRLRAVHFKGARWVDKDSIIQHYWGGATPDSRKCACAMDGSCAQDANGYQHDCNCDVFDSTWRHDDGFITDKNRLPVLEMQFSKGKETDGKSFFTVGALKCYGTVRKPTQPPTTVKTDATVPTLKPIIIDGTMFFNTSEGKIPAKPILINGQYFVNNSGVLIPLPNLNNVTIKTEAAQIPSDTIASLFSKPWLVSLIIIGSILCLLLVFMLYLLFRKNVYGIFMKCVYGNHATKPRIEIEDYNRYSTATEEESDWDIYRLSTTFPTSTPEPSYGPTDDESVTMRVRTLEDVRGKRRFKRLTGWGSRTASAPTVVGSLSKYSISEKDESICFPNPEAKALPNDYETKLSSENNYEYVESERAYSTTATDGECDSVIDDSVSEFSQKSSHHSNDSSMKESECSSQAPMRPNSRATDTSKNSGDVERPNRIGFQNADPNQSQQRPNGIHPIKMNGSTNREPVKAYYPVLPFNGYRQPAVRRAHPNDYGSHLAMVNNNGNRCPRFVAVNNRRQSSGNEAYSNMIHQTIQERDELSEEEIQAQYENPRNSDGFYELYDHGDNGSPSSETRLLFDDASSREECVREADEKIKLLKKKVIEKATSADECT